MAAPKVKLNHFQHFLDMVKSSRLLAPNLREMTLRFYTGNKHGGNAVARDLVLKHLLALRWMNPNAVIYLREYKGQGSPEVDYELCKSPEDTWREFVKISGAPVTLLQGRPRELQRRPLRSSILSRQLRSSPRSSWQRATPRCRRLLVEIL